MRSSPNRSSDPARGPDSSRRGTDRGPCASGARGDQAQIGPDRTAADAALANALASEAAANADPYLIAQIHALRGDAAHAVEWLQRASTDDLLFLPTDPLILNLRDDPRFIAFCARIGLPPPGESEALSIDQLRAANGTRKR